MGYAASCLDLITKLSSMHISRRAIDELRVTSASSSASYKSILSLLRTTGGITNPSLHSPLWATALVQELVVPTLIRLKDQDYVDS